MKRLKNLLTASLNYIRWSWRFAHFPFRSRLASPDMITNPNAIKIGQKVEIRKHARLEALGKIEKNKTKISIGDGTSIHLYFHCGAAESITIGKDVLIASRVYISDHDHDFQDPQTPTVYAKKLITKPVNIEDGVWIGEGAVILKGVNVGTRAVIGANAVVTKDVPPYAIVGGVPARVIRYIELDKEKK